MWIFSISGKESFIDLSVLVVFSFSFSKYIGFCLHKDNHWQLSQFRDIINEMNQLWNAIPKQFTVLIILNWSISKVHLF